VAPPSLIAPLLAPLLTGLPLYAMRGGDGVIPGTTQPFAALPLGVGVLPRNHAAVRAAVALWQQLGLFNATQAEVRPKKTCSPRHHSHVQPSFIECQTQNVNITRYTTGAVSLSTNHSTQYEVTRDAVAEFKSTLG